MSIPESPVTARGLLLAANGALALWHPGATAYHTPDADELRLWVAAARGVPVADHDGGPAWRLIAAGFLSAGALRDAATPPFIFPRSPSTTPSPSRGPVRLRRNFAAWPAAQGLETWSRRCNAPLRLPEELDPFLERLARGFDPERADVHLGLGAALAPLVEAGVILSCADLAAEDALLERHIRSSGDVLDMEALLHPTFTRTGPARRSAGVPVYFIHSLVGRTSGHFPDGVRAKWGRSNYLPLALGMILAHL
ncbi:hypothetical protein Q2941_50795, partial [Bradyrhizobium sp. UFLA05-153]